MCCPFCETIWTIFLKNKPKMHVAIAISYGILYPGLHILSGDPKAGKSWMMMDLCLSVAKGEKFLGRKTEQGHVVYMALEDTFISLQTRMYELTDEPTDNLQYVLTANTLGDGLEHDLRVCKKQFDDLKLIVIDTLQKIRGAADSKYSTDYHDLSALKQIADELEIAIVAVHHNRKMHDANPNHMIAGTTGLTGCADGLLVLLKKPNEHTALLHISGRGAPQLELHLVREDAKWRPVTGIIDTRNCVLHRDAVRRGERVHRKHITAADILFLWYVGCFV